MSHSFLSAAGRSCFVLGLIFSGSAAAQYKALTGEVVAVSDGDTLVVQLQQKRIQVRLAEIDAPELQQSFGDRAAASLADLCLQKQVSVEALGTEPSGRVIGRVKCEDIDAGTAQVQRGMAWVAVSGKLRKTAAPLYYLQDVAQRSREGLWKEQAPLAPWLWRKTRRPGP